MQCFFKGNMALLYREECMTFRTLNSRKRKNNTADYMWRLQNENTECKLFQIVFSNSVTYFTLNHVIDLFASCFK